MRPFRSLAVPALCFVTAWGIAWFAGRHFGKSADQPIAPSHSGPTKVRRERPDPTKVSIAKLMEDFRHKPMDVWAGQWDAFARDTTVDDLAKLSRSSSSPRWDGHRIEASYLLNILASEELAVRTGIPVEHSPASFAALADADPQAAWKSLAGSYSTSALRVLAGKNPEETLRRYRSMSAGAWTSVDNGSGADAAVSQRPLGAIFGAWARRDPLAAAAGVKKLPPSDRTEAANHVAITWAFRDGPAAIRYLLDLDKTGERFTTLRLRLDVVLRASFRTHPSETARLMRESPMLRRIIGKHPNLHVAFGPWQDADPAGAIDWIREQALHGDHDAAGHLKPGHKPGAAATILRAGFSAGLALGENHLIPLYLRDPELALSLADELGIPLRDHPRLEELRVRIDPADACDRWLEALRESGDPAAALASLGWSGITAIDLAGRMARVFPDKAAELAKRVPASSFDPAHLWRLKQNRSAVRLWPELEKDPAGIPAEPPFPQYRFRYDPAAAAEAFSGTGPDAGQVAMVVEHWAPYDPHAARAWLMRLHEGQARQEGLLVLARILANDDPVAALESLISSGRPDRSGAIRRVALHRLLYSGGDWQGWLARLSEHSPDDWWAHGLAEEARLLDHLRQIGP